MSDIKIQNQLAGMASESEKQVYLINDLSGNLLNLAVANVLNIKASIFEVNNGLASFNRCCVLDGAGRLAYQYEPSTNWVFGGPLIEEYKIPVYRSVVNEWVAFKESHSASGETMLIAAMRCLVKFKLDRIEIRM